MSEAAKLFNQSGGAANGGKQDVINGAAQVRQNADANPIRRAMSEY